MRIALRMLQEADTPFKPATKAELKSRGPKPQMANLEVMEAIERVVDYLWDDEMKSWEEDGHEEGDPIEDGYILFDLNVLRKFIEGG